MRAFPSSFTRRESGAFPERSVRTMHDCLHGRLLMIAVLLVSVGVAFGQARVSATLSRSVVAAGETVDLQLSFEGGAPNEIRLPVLEGVEFLGQSSGTQIQVNGTRFSQMRTYTMRYRATREGTLVFPSMRFAVGNETIETPELSLHVTKDVTAERIKRLAFGTMILPKREFYLGETIPVEFHLHYQLLGSDPSMPQLTADGFTLLSKLQYAAPEKVRANDSVYDRLVFRTALVAVRPGALKLGPFSAALLLRVPSDPDSFGRRSAQMREVIISSEPVELNILPLPAEGQPAEFAGAVGAYAMQVAISPTNLSVGDPVTLKISIGGNGAIESLKLPEWVWGQFEHYPPTSGTQLSDPIGIIGRKDFALVISPREAGEQRIPELRFSYFDPTAREYRTLRHPETVLNVAGVTKSAPPDAIAAETPASQEPDIAPLAVRLGSLHPPGSLLVQRGWFLAAQMAPLAALALIWVAAASRARKAHITPEQRRAEHVHQMTTSLASLRRHSADGNAAEFFALLSETLRRHLAFVLNRTAAGITEDAIENLVQHDVPENDRAQWARLFEACNESHYAPAEGPRQMDDLLRTLEPLIQTPDTSEVPR